MCDLEQRTCEPRTVRSITSIHSTNLEDLHLSFIFLGRDEAFTRILLHDLYSNYVIGNRKILYILQGVYEVSDPRDCC